MRRSTPPRDLSERTMNRTVTPEEELLRGVSAVKASSTGIRLDDPIYNSLPPEAQTFLDSLLQVQLLGRSSVGEFLRKSLAHFDDFADTVNLGQSLVTAGLLTDYQLDRIIAGTTHGLLLGNYRVLDRLGSGSMGVVFLA